MLAYLLTAQPTPPMSVPKFTDFTDENQYSNDVTINETRMWANAQRDGRPAECKWRPLFNAENFG